MIIDTLENADKYAAIHSGFAAAFDYLKSAIRKRPPLGRHEIDGDRVYAIVADSPSHGVEGARLEYHRKYIDIQMVTSHTDVFGWMPLQACTKESEAYSEDTDLGFFADEPESWLIAPPGTFVVFFPEDAHAPLCGEGIVGKIVVKVMV